MNTVNQPSLNAGIQGLPAPNLQEAQEASNPQKLNRSSILKLPSKQVTTHLSKAKKAFSKISKPLHQRLASLVSPKSHIKTQKQSPAQALDSLKSQIADESSVMLPTAEKNTAYLKQRATKATALLKKAETIEKQISKVLKQDLQAKALKDFGSGEYDTAALEQEAVELHEQAVSLVNKRKAELSIAKKDLNKQENAVKASNNIIQRSTTLQKSISRDAESKLRPLGDSSADLKLHLENLNSAKKRMVGHESKAKKLFKSITSKELQYGFTLTDEKRSLAKAAQTVKQKIGQLASEIKQTKIKIKSALTSEKQRALQEKQEQLQKKQEQLQAEGEKLKSGSDQNSPPG